MRPHRALPTLALLAVVAACGGGPETLPEPAAPAEPPARRAVSVHVTHCLSGLPVIGAKVTLDGAEATTDPEGIVRGTIPDGGGSVAVSAEGLVGASRVLGSDPEASVLLCPAGLPEGAVLAHGDGAGGVVALAASSVARSPELEFGSGRYALGAAIPHAEAKGAARIGNRRRLLVDSRLLARTGSGPGAFYSGLVVTDPTGPLLSDNHWRSDGPHAIPPDARAPKPGAWVGNRLAWKPADASFEVETGWTKLGAVRLPDAAVPAGWTLVELGGVGPWGIVTTVEPAPDRVFLVRR